MATTHRFGCTSNSLAKYWHLSALIVLLSLVGCGAGAGSGNSGNSISVTITNKASSIQAGTAALVFTATVQNDSSNSGVTWTLTAGGSSCSPACGALSQASSTAVTYTPPNSAPAAPSNQPTLTATSVAKTNKSDSDAFTITPALTVTITNKFGSLNTGTSPFVVNATVQNDSTNSGVTWMLTANGAACPGTACGTLTGITTSSVTYSPPATAPVNATLTATSVHDPTKSDSNGFTINQASVIVIIQDKLTSVFAGSSRIFVAANVLNDFSSNPSTTWKLTANGTDCTVNTCGTLSAAGAESIIYNPPTSVPLAPFDKPTLTATSIADTAKSDSDTFTITSAPPISVTITKIASILGAGTGIELSAFVQNDFSNSGVTWTLTCVPPAANCGALLSSASTTTATYKPQGSEPAQATVQAFSNADNTASPSYTFNVTSSVANGCTGTATGQESLLKGHYALQLQGFWSGGSGIPKLLTASFQADGRGGVTGGEEDVNDGISPQHLTFTSSGSLYTVGADHRGCLQLTNAGGTTAIFRFALGSVNSGVASKGRIIEFDDSSGNGAGSRGSGILRLQDPNSFVLSALRPQYAFGVGGWGIENSQFIHFNTAGSFNNSGGNLSAGVDDVNFAGITTPDSAGLTGLINPISVSTGYATGSFDFFDWAIYVVNSSEFLVISTDPISATLSEGRAVATGNSFTAGSLSGNYIAHSSGNTNGKASVDLQLLTMAPGGGQTGTLSGTVYSDGAGSGLQTTPLSSVAYNIDPASGRVVLGNPADNLPILYLTTPTDGISGFLVGMGADAQVGLVEFQPTQTYSTASAAGTYFFGTEDPGDNSVTDNVGAATVASSGSVNGTLDSSGSAGLSPGVPFNLSLTVSNANGTGSFGAQTVAIINGTKIFYIDETTGSIVVAEQ